MHDCNSDGANGEFTLHNRIEVMRFLRTDSFPLIVSANPRAARLNSSVWRLRVAFTGVERGLLTLAIGHL